MPQLGLKAAVLEIDGEIHAYTAGFINPSNVGIILFEKADPEYEGIYQAVNYLFINHSFKQCRFINRQEDLGLEGLRKAKMSYHPFGFAEKYRVRFLQE